jgi:hypothetical protein
MKLEFFFLFLEKFSNIKFYKNLSSGGPSSFMWADGQTDGQTDMTKLIVAFRNYKNAPNKNE